VRPTGEAGPPTRNRRCSDAAATGAGLVLGAVADRLLADPRRFHPVAGYGGAVSRWERAVYRPSRMRGAMFAAVAVGTPLAVGLAANRMTRGRPVLRVLAVGLGTWTVLGGTSLGRTGDRMADLLDPPGALAAARALLPHLCGRDPQALDAVGLLRASTESVAENTSDAVVGALLWGAVAGLPGLLAFRAANTLDAMVGHRTQRYERFGWASARLDDLLGWLPARLTAVLMVGCAPMVGGRPADAWRAWRRDAAAHPSPNAGPCEAAAAGALGVRLGGPTAYRHRVECRPLLGRGHPPGPDDLRRAVRLSAAVGWATLAALAIGRWIAMRGIEVARRTPPVPTIGGVRPKGP
jgi:adenosylcobinamide-phosphate synthase